MTKRLLGVHIYLFYISALGRMLRLILWFFVALSIFTAVSSGHTPSRFILFLLGILFMIDMFIRFKLTDTKQEISLADTKRADISDSFSNQLLLVYAASRSETDFLERLLQQKLAQFFLKKADITKTEMQKVSFEYKTLFLKAEEVAKKRNGTVITTGDVIASYFLVSEDSTKLLFKKELKEKDVIAICSWAIFKWRAEEEIGSNEVHFNGLGYADGLVYGWTPETKKYTKEIGWNLKDMSMQLVGRTSEFEDICRGLLKKENNNILLVGPAGSGKEYLIKHFAMMSYRGLLHKGLNHKRLLELLIGEFVAGANEQGMIEERVGNIIAEIAHAGNVVLYIANFDQLLGSSGFSLDMSGVLMPHLKEHELPIIAAVTTGAYKQFVEKSPLREMFTIVPLESPTDERMQSILFIRANSIERDSRVVITYNALKAAMLYASSYMPDDYLPGSAVRLLIDAVSDLTSSKDAVLRKTDIIKKITKQTHIPVGQPTDAEATLLLHLEETLQKEVIGQDKALKALTTALQRIRATQKTRSKPVSFLFLGPTGVGKTQTVKVLANTYFDGEQNIIRMDMSEYANEDGLEKLIGAGETKGLLTDVVHDKPYSLILLDEFEKAHPKVHNAFLQVLDDGRLTDGNGQTISFANTFLVATSNAGSELIRESMKSTDVTTDIFKRQLLDGLLELNVFRPELLNRFDDIIVFTPLSTETARKITELLLAKLIASYKSEDIVLSIDESVITKILTEGFDNEFGARPLARYIANTIESPVSKKILEKSVKRGDSLSLRVGPQNQLVIS